MKFKKNKQSPKSRRSTIIIVCLLSATVFLGNTGYIQAKAVLAQYLIENAWVQTLTDNSGENQLKSTHKPWSWADVHPVAKLRIPAHHIEQYVLSGANGASLPFAPGLYTGTRLLGEKSPLPDAVIAGHHNTHFDFLKQMKLNELIRIQTFSGKWQNYRVSAINRYDIQKSRLPVIIGGQTIRLVTCLPKYLGEIHPNGRLVVTATRVER